MGLWASCFSSRSLSFLTCGAGVTRRTGDVEEAVAREAEPRAWRGGASVAAAAAGAVLMLVAPAHTPHPPPAPALPPSRLSQVCSTCSDSVSPPAAPSSLSISLTSARVLNPRVPSSSVSSSTSPWPLTLPTTPSCWDSRLWVPQSPGVPLTCQAGPPSTGLPSMCPFDVGAPQGTVTSFLTLLGQPLLLLRLGVNPMTNKSQLSLKCDPLPELQVSPRCLPGCPTGVSHQHVLT